MKDLLLLAALNYAIEQAESSDIDILEWADSDHTLLVDEQIVMLKELRNNL